MPIRPGVANLGFYKILAQTPVAFPHPTNTDELTAFQNISTQLCGTACNVRNQYPDTNVSIEDYLTILRGLKAPGNNDCTDDKNAGLPFWHRPATAPDRVSRCCGHSRFQ
jgi:hypothetical protein